MSKQKDKSVKEESKWWDEDAERLNRMAEVAKKSGKVIHVLPKEEEKAK